MLINYFGTNMKTSFMKFGVVLLALSVSSSLHAQQKKLTPADYAQWQNVGFFTAFSNNGNWFSYNISLVEGDGWLMLINNSGETEHKFMYSSGPVFSNNNKWFAFRIGVSEDEEKKLEDQKKPVQFDLGLMNLETAKVDTFETIQSFSFSEKGDFLVMKKYKAEEIKTGGTDIILRSLASGTNQLIGNVSDYRFNDAGTYLALTLDASEKLGNGVHLINLAANSTTVLDSDTESYTTLTWHEEDNSLAFLKTNSDTTHKGETNLVYAYQNVANTGTVKIFDQKEISSFPADHKVVDFAGLNWSDDGQTIFFGIKEWELDEEEPKDTTAIGKLDKDLDPTNVEIWHWKDEEIQPQQEVRQNQNKRENYLSAWHLNNNSFIQLENEQTETVFLTGDKEFAIGYDASPYEPRFREGWNDIYIIDVSNGQSKKILDRIEGVGYSEGGKFLTYFKDDNWWTYDIRKDKHTNITGGIDAHFENFTAIFGRENFRPFGMSQWAENDEWVLIYDQYDVYKVWPDGSNYVKLTNGAADQIRYRQSRQNLEDDFIPNGDPIYLSKYGDMTKDQGFARVDRRNRLTELIYESRSVSRLIKAKDAERFIYLKQSATESPNYFYTTNFSDETVLSNTNTQQDEYLWADDELITFTNERGEILQGRLLYPADYEEGKQYPMITYIYELRSQSLHSYSIPSRTSPYNMRRYSSEGYFVFEPDITYELRDPGVSAVQSVVPAVQKVLETGMVNPEQVGLTGHSWGAYQTAFIITQTNIFNSAVAGAPLTNMISMYSSIYWNSGTTDAQIFEVSQGRFPDPYWKDWDNFVENSPVFNMENTTTPLLVEFCTNDGAVDFNQGVELYTTMRRMEKPYVMLVYEGENHGLRQRENMIDYATRAFQWHEHFLKGAEAPDWITKGLPWLKRPEVKDK